MSSDNNLVNTKEVSLFLQIARAYCSIIESYQSTDSKAFLTLLQRLLLELYAAGLNLPDAFSGNDNDTNLDIPDEEFKALLKFIDSRVPFAYYSVTLDPIKAEHPAETGLGDLVDDLGDIYRDIKRGLLLLDNTGDIEDAIWYFKFLLKLHWGEHCVEALYAIHHYLAENG